MKKSMFVKIYIIPIILSTPILMISCNSWFSIWIMMELNLMSFIPLIIFFNKFFKELSIKYFIVQSISSSILVISSNLLFFNLFNLKVIIILLINLSLLMKIGAPPFHNWFINMMNNMNWINCLILSTWQKIIPLISLMYIFNKYLIYLISLISSIIGSIMGLNHQSIRLIMSFSSINHLGWIFLNMMISEYMWLYYFFSYFSINLSIMLMFNKLNIYYLNQIPIFKMNFFLKFIFLMNFFSISCLPPLFGFSMKWISLYYLNMNNNQILLIIMISMSILTFMFYTRICINFILNYKLMNKLILINKFSNTKSFKKMFFFSLFLNLWIISIWMF